MERLRSQKPDIDKLIASGFKMAGDELVYSELILDSQMNLTFTVKDGVIRERIVDVESGEEYVLHRIEGAVGAYVGQVREEFKRIVDKIYQSCYDTDAFKWRQSKAVIGYALDRYGAAAEYLWKKTPDNAIFRRGDTDKWFGAILTVRADKLGLGSTDKLEILDLRAKPEDIERIVDCKDCFPGYHMNKKHWYTVILDGRVRDEELFLKIDESYNLAK